MDKKKPVEFLPDIFEYLEQENNSKTIRIKNLDEIVYKMHASTALSKEACEIILQLFFQEIRNGMLRGDLIILRDFGKLQLMSPKTSNSKKRIFPKFIIDRKLKRKLNDS